MAGPVRDFRGTEDGEWYVANGDFDDVAGAEAVPQGIRVRVGMFAGECYLDSSKGVAWLDSILIKNPDPLVVKALLQEPIANTPDVTNVIAADLDLDTSTREGNISYEADTVYNDDPISGQLSSPV